MLWPVAIAKQKNIAANSTNAVLILDRAFSSIHLFIFLTLDWGRNPSSGQALFYLYPHKVNWGLRAACCPKRIRGKLSTAKSQAMRIGNNIFYLRIKIKLYILSSNLWITHAKVLITIFAALNSGRRLFGGSVCGYARHLIR